MSLDGTLSKPKEQPRGAIPEVQTYRNKDHDLWFIDPTTKAAVILEKSPGLDEERDWQQNNPTESPRNSAPNFSRSIIRDTEIPADVNQFLVDHPEAIIEGQKISSVPEPTPPPAKVEQAEVIPTPPPREAPPPVVSSFAQSALPEDASKANEQIKIDNGEVIPYENIEKTLGTAIQNPRVWRGPFKRKVLQEGKVIEMDIYEKDTTTKKDKKTKFFPRRLFESSIRSWINNTKEALDPSGYREIDGKIFHKATLDFEHTKELIDINKAIFDEQHGVSGAEQQKASAPESKEIKQNPKLIPLDPDKGWERSPKFIVDMTGAPSPLIEYWSHPDAPGLEFSENEKNENILAWNSINRAKEVYDPKKIQYIPRSHQPPRVGSDKGSIIEPYWRHPDIANKQLTREDVMIILDDYMEKNGPLNPNKFVDKTPTGPAGYTYSEFGPDIPFTISQYLQNKKKFEQLSGTLPPAEPQGGTGGGQEIPKSPGARTSSASTEKDYVGPLRGGSRRSAGTERTSSNSRLEDDIEKDGNDDSPPRDTVGNTAERRRGSSDKAQSEPWKEIDMTKYDGVTTRPLLDIINDKNGEQQLFGEVLRRILKDKDRIDAILLRGRAGKLTLEEIQITNYAQFELARGIKLAKEAINKINPADIELMMERDEMFKGMVRLHGVGPMVEALKKDLPHLAMRDPEQVVRLLDSYHQLAVRKDTWRYERWQNRVTKLCEKVKIQESEFDRIFDLHTKEGRKATERRLYDKLLHEQEVGDLGKSFKPARGFLRSVKSMMSVNKKSRMGFGGTDDIQRQVNNIMAEAISVDDMLHDPFIPGTGPMGASVRDAKRHMNTIADTFASAIKREGFQESIISQSFGEAPKPEASTTGPQTAEEAKKAQEQFSPEKMKESFDREKVLHAATLGKTWETMNMSEKTKFRDEIWSPSEVNSALESQGLGFWASMFRALAKALFESAKKKMPLN